MADLFSQKLEGFDDLRSQLLDLAPGLRRGPAQKALQAGMEPVLRVAYAATPQLAADIYRHGVMIRRAGTLRRALTVRKSKDAAANGDVGVFLNIKPLTQGAIGDFKEATGRAGSQNPQDPYFWRFVTFATKRNPNPSRFLQKAGEALPQALPIVGESLRAYFERLNKRLAK